MVSGVAAGQPERAQLAYAVVTAVRDESPRPSATSPVDPDGATETLGDRRTPVRRTARPRLRDLRPRSRWSEPAFFVRSGIDR